MHGTRHWGSGKLINLHERDIERFDPWTHDDNNSKKKKKERKKRTVVIDQTVAGELMIGNSTPRVEGGSRSSREEQIKSLRKEDRNTYRWARCRWAGFAGVQR